MAESAVLLADHVLPAVAYRQTAVLAQVHEVVRAADGKLRGVGDGTDDI